VSQRELLVLVIRRSVCGKAGGEEDYDQMGGTSCGTKDIVTEAFVA
jgi:hypothetical protein